MKFILIETSKAPTVIDVTWDVARRLIPGWLEMVKPAPNVHAYIDEDGKSKNLPINAVATALMGSRLRPGDYIVGPMLICGSQNDGEEHDVPQVFIDAILKFKPME